MMASSDTFLDEYQDKVKSIIYPYLIKYVKHLTKIRHKRTNKALFPLAVLYGASAYQEHSRLCNLDVESDIQTLDLDFFLGTKLPMYGEYDDLKIQKLFRKETANFWEQSTRTRHKIIDSLQQFCGQKCHLPLPEDIRIGNISYYKDDSWMMHEQYNVMRTYYIQHIFLQVNNQLLDVLQVNIKPLSWLREQNFVSTAPNKIGEIFVAGKHFLELLFRYALRSHFKKLHKHLKRKEMFEFILDNMEIDACLLKTS